MTYYKTCPLCGAHLDLGEVCDCVSAYKEEKEAPAGATNTGEGKAEQSRTPVSPLL